ncbi:MAG: YdcF family protein [Firmicutes bacterium]|nr:YdcF family protein [Bacillota bacterium]MDD4264227.1 YdcF family protein [Bacillota bacterium]MDD4693116.1 YdcF family protein [Bacillota bacterium]
MRISDLNPESLTQDQVERLLFTGIFDDEKIGDCILVFGSTNSLSYRLPGAIKLYHKKRAPYLLLSGGTVKGMISEAEIMKQKAISLKVPESAILIEDRSTNTKENILFSLEILKNTFSKQKLHILLVTTMFHMRRCILSAETFFPANYTYTSCPVKDLNTLPGIWYKNPKAKNRALNEAKNLVRYVQSGELKDSLLD